MINQYLTTKSLKMTASPKYQEFDWMLNLEILHYSETNFGYLESKLSHYCYLW